MVYESQDKAGYNQSARITEVLGNLLIAYISHMNSQEYENAVKVIRRILDIISAKIKPEETLKTNNLIYGIEKDIPIHTQTYLSQGKRYIRYPEKMKEMEKRVENLFRIVNKLQDKYGYGMISLKDPRMAVLQH